VTAALTALALVVGGLVALGGPTHWLLGAYFASQLRQDTWTMSGVFIDGIDLTLAAVAVSVMLRGLPQESRGTRLPLRWLWVGLAVLLVLSYAMSPSGSVHMTDPARAVYQSYRYALRGVIMYPLCYLFVTNGRKFDDVLTMVIVVACVCSVMSWVQGYGGQWGTGPFSTKNGLAAALAAPVVLITMDLLYGKRPGWSLLGLLVLGRGALFASSRGAFAGMLVGATVGWWCMSRTGLRSRAVAVAAAGILAVGVLLAAKPDLLERPTVARFFTTFDAEQDTLVWRTGERWPHFFQRALAKPWVGWGDAVDVSLGPKANTPHNGYLSIAVTNGFPVLICYLLFAGIALVGAWRLGARGRDPDERLRAAKICGALACIWTHNVIDAVVVLPFVGGQLWLYTAYVARMAKRGRVAERTAAPMPHDTVPRTAVSPVASANRP